MIKKLICGMAVCAMFAGCSEDFKDWLSPQANSQDDIQTATLSVSGVDPILMADVTTEKVKVFDASLTAFEQATATFDIVLTDPETSTKYEAITADAEGQVATADLTTALNTLYGKRPVARTMSALVSAYVSDGTQAIRKQGTINVTATPDAPVIEQAYYLIGTQNGWSTDTYKDWKFSHSDADVYSDPVFTITVTAPTDADGNRVDFWFNIVPESATTSADFLGSLIGSSVGNGDTSTEGFVANKVNGANNSFCQPASDGAISYEITINMLEGTIKIVPGFGDPEVWYLVGSNVGNGTWTNGSTSDVGVSLIPLHPDLTTLDGATGKSVLSYTGYFTNADGFKLIKTPGSWDDQWGATTNGTLVKNDGGSGNIYVPADGYYTVKLDLLTDALTITPYDGTPIVRPQMLITGGFDGWGRATQMSPVNTAACVSAHNHLWSYTLDASSGSTEVKFLTDSSWATNWGSSDFPIGTGTSGGPNIPVEQGTWIVTFNDINGTYIFTRK